MSPRLAFRHSRKILILTLGTVVLVAGLLAFGPAPVKTEAQPTPAPEGLYSYAVKIVCGFNDINGELSPDGKFVGEAEVKLGNYASEVNIYHPALDESITADIRKKFIPLSVQHDYRGREPKSQRGDFFDSISLPGGSATMDDCNLLYRATFGAVPGTPPPLLVGYLVLLSNRELDVTAVYTAEICSDWTINEQQGPRFICASPDGNFGAGISMDVERIDGRFLTQ